MGRSDRREGIKQVRSEVERLPDEVGTKKEIKAAMEVW